LHQKSSFVGEAVGGSVRYLTMSKEPEDRPRSAARSRANRADEAGRNPRFSWKVAPVGIGTHPPDTDEQSKQNGQSMAWLGCRPVNHRGNIMKQWHLIPACALLTFSSMGCAMQADIANDASPLEVDSTQSELRQGALTTQNGYGRTVENLKGVNMVLDNWAEVDTGKSCGKVRFIANVELPEGATIIDYMSSSLCRGSDGQSYSRVSPRGRLEFWNPGQPGEPLDKQLYLACCDALEDRLLSTTLSWGVDN
jgi:hypothetical protein